ncbi:MAG: HepT-like ribonuclease domain-containing protein [Thermoanaerobaculia bacterium]
MRLEVKKYLFDIQQAAKLVLLFTAGLSFQEYAKNPMARSAVERQLMTLGESLNKLSQIDPSVASRVSADYRRIISFRNVLIHDYDSILDEVVWGVVETRLPPLLQEVETMLRGE